MLRPVLWTAVVACVACSFQVKEDTCEGLEESDWEISTEFDHQCAETKGCARPDTPELPDCDEQRSGAFCGLCAEKRCIAHVIWDCFTDTDTDADTGP